MVKNYLSVSIKHLRKQKAFSIINVLGLTVGITCCFLIFLFIQNELSYDGFHRNGENIYRVMRVGNNNGVQREIPYLSPPFGPALLNDYPHAIVAETRVMKDNNLISHHEIGYNEKDILLTDPNFFQFFDFRLKKGNKASVLNDPNSIVLTETSAKKYFGDENPIGQILQFNKKQPLKVTGVCEDVPVNSHLQFDMVIPLELLRPMQPNWFLQWPNNGLFTYVQLNPSVKPEQLKKTFPAFMDKYLGDYYATAGFKMGLTIQPLKDVYFASDAMDNVKHGNKKMVYIFLCIAVAILLIACINFINLATARASERSKEVGLRKVLGAIRGQLIGQFMTESLLFATLGCLLSVALVQLLMPAYSNLLGYRLPPFWNQPAVYLFLLGVILVVGFLAGSYPAFLLSSFSPIESLKGKLRLGKSGSFFRKTLVVFQFTVSVLLIISVSIMMSQMRFLRTTDLGFRKEQAVIVRFDNLEIAKKRLSFKNELEKIPSVESVSLMSGEPGGFHDGYSFESEGKPGEKLLFRTEYADFDFVKTLGLNVVAGRDFSASFKTDSLQAALINRTAANILGYSPEQAVGKWIKNLVDDSVSRRVIGVVEDYHFSSLKDKIEPLVISPGRDDRLALIRLQTTQLSSALAAIEAAYSKAASNYPFEYRFLDEQFDRAYKTEASQQAVLTIFSIISIFIACLGLFGLASFTALKRTKEIGVRKVLGSSIQNIVLLLSKDLLKPVLMGTLIALPLGYYFMHRWLESFAYRIEFQWWMFALAIGLAVFIALVTVGVQAMKAALANPIKSLRTE